MNRTKSNSAIPTFAVFGKLACCEILSLLFVEFRNIWTNRTMLFIQLNRNNRSNNGIHTYMLRKPNSATYVIFFKTYHDKVNTAISLTKILNRIHIVFFIIQPLNQYTNIHNLFRLILFSFLAYGLQNIWYPNSLL